MLLTFGQLQRTRGLDSRPNARCGPDHPQLPLSRAERLSENLDPCHRVLSASAAPGLRPQRIEPKDPTEK